jgi:molecular chaperone DnaK
MTLILSLPLPLSGGDDFDRIIVEWIIEQYNLQHNTREADTFQGNPMISSRLFQAAEEIKATLSSEPNADVNIPFLSGEKGLTSILTRRKFEQISKKLFQRLLQPIRQVAIMAGKLKCFTYPNLMIAISTHTIHRST